MFDKQLVFDGTFDTAGAGTLTGVAITTTRVSTNVLDLLSARDVGAGDELELHVDVTTTFTSTLSTTLQIAFQSCATAGGTYKDLMLSPVYALADLVAGAKIFRYKLPIMNQLNATAPWEFIGLNYTVATGPFTLGKVAAWITGGGDRQAFSVYGPNYTVGA